MLREVTVAQSCLTLCDPTDCIEIFQPRDRSQVSRIAGGFFTVWATREAWGLLCLLLTQLLQLFYSWKSLAQMVKNPPEMQKTWVQSRKIPWRRAGQPTPVFLHGKSPGQRRLMYSSLWGCKKNKRERERRDGGWEDGDRGWDGRMASPTQWTWVGANSGRWWTTRKPGVLQSMEVTKRQDFVTKQQIKNSFLMPLVSTVNFPTHSIN